MPNSQILINPVHIPSTDRSVHYGDASFTTMYCEQGKICLLQSHVERLKLACNTLDIKFGDWLILQKELCSLAISQATPCVIKVIISRGSGGRGYQPPQSQQPICIITVHHADPMRSQANINLVKISQIMLPSHHKIEGIKHNNRLAQVMARQAALLDDCDDVLMCDHRGHVMEASSANLFYTIDNCWYTPPLSHCGVKGVMRDAFIQYLADTGRFLNYASHHVDQFSQAQTVLLSNAVKGLRQVCQLQHGDQLTVFKTTNESFIATFIEQILNSELST